MAIKVRIRLPRSADAAPYAIAAAGHVLLALLFMGFGSATGGTGRLGPSMAVRLAGGPAGPPRAPRAASTREPAREPQPVKPEPLKSPKGTNRTLAGPEPKTVVPRPTGTTAQPQTLPVHEEKPLRGKPSSETDATRDGTASGAPGAPSTKLPEGPIAGGISGMITDEPLGADWYNGLVFNRLQDAWRDRPVLPTGTENRRVVIAFVIERDGTVADAEVAVPSGYAPLDSSALRVVSSLGRLPKLPREYGKDRIRARFVFELTPPL